jgi:hypothetical protein
MYLQIIVTLRYYINQEIKILQKDRSSDQASIALAIKILDPRRSWKYRTHSGENNYVLYMGVCKQWTGLLEWITGLTLKALTSNLAMK